MYFICARWRQFENSPAVFGYAICSDPDTPVAFLHADGSPYDGDVMWSYSLLHHKPWAKLEADK